MSRKWTEYTLFDTIGRMSDATDYLQRIQGASVYDVAIKSPFEIARNLSARLDNEIWLKREDLQPVFSFKLRGATNKLASLSAADLANGVICSSAGNHAQGVALAAKRRGIKAVIVMPVTTPSIKVDAVRALGGDVVLHGDTYDDAYAHARELEQQHGLFSSTHSTIPTSSQARARSASKSWSRAMASSTQYSFRLGVAG
jgi:threonine dehydratase